MDISRSWSNEIHFEPMLLERGHGPLVMGKTSDSSDTHEISRVLKSANLSLLVRRINRARHRAVRRVASRSLIRCVGASWRRVTNDTRLLLPVYAMLSVWCYAIGQGRERVKGALWRTTGEKERATVRVYDARKEIEGKYHRSWVSLESLGLSSFICIDNTICDLGNG